MSNGDKENLIENNTAFNLQQSFCNSFGYSDQIVWDSYYLNEKSALSLKIKNIFGISEGDTQLNKKVDQIIEAVWNQKKYNGNILLMVPIFITCIDYREYEDPTYDQLSTSTKYTIHPVFRVRKCINNNDSSGCCMIFVDEHARVYQNWNDFKKDNLLPKSYVLAPLNGIYNTDNEDNVKLEFFLPPSGTTLGNIAEVANTTATIGQVGAGILLLATLPFSAPAASIVAAGATAVGFTCNAYTTGKSIISLNDMNNHEQSIGIENREARSAYISIAGSVTSALAGVASQCIGFLAKSGSNIGTASRATVNIINGATIVVNGIGVGNGVFDFIINYDSYENVSKLEVLQLASSLFLLTHSVVSFQSASEMITNYQNKTIYELRNDLSRNNKRIFDKMYKESIRVSGVDASKSDLIRTLRNVPDKHQFFRDLYKVNKNLNQNNVKISFKGEPGVAFLNHEVPIVPNVLRENLKTNTASQVFGSVPEMPISRTTSNVVNSNSSITPNIKYIQSTVTALVRICSSLDINNLRNSIINIVESLTIQACDMFFNFLEEFLRSQRTSIEEQLHRFIPVEQFINDIFKIMIDLAGEHVSDFLERNIHNRELMYKLIHEFYDSLRPQGTLSGNCNICNGRYYIC